MVYFSIASSQICEEEDKKYVSYALKVFRGEDAQSDAEPAEIRRRYTQFSELYNNLRKDFPTLMNGVNFPKKVIMGNFDVKLIMNRSSGFDSLLEHIAKDSRLREAQYTIDFFHKSELIEAERLMKENKFDLALSYFENILKLLNKIYTDRSEVVLIALCKLVACGARLSDDASADSASLAGPTERWASLALKRFDGVCDADLLLLYAPLIQACIHIYKTLGKDCKPLEDILTNMRKKGMKVDPTVSLMDAIRKYEESLKA